MNYQSCGSWNASANHRLRYDFVARVDTGSDNGQRSTLTLSSNVNLGDISANDIMEHGGMPYQVVSVNVPASQITLYPHLNNPASTIGNITSMHGGGVKMFGGNATGCTVDNLRGIFAGCGVWFAGLYGGTIGHMTSEASSIGLRFGEKFASGSGEAAHIGSSVSHAHLEGCTFDILRTGAVSNVFVTATPYMSFGRCFGMGWRLATDVRGGLDWEEFGSRIKISFEEDIYTKTMRAYNDVKNTPLANNGFRISSADAATIPLKLDKDSLRLYRANTVNIHLIGGSSSSWNLAHAATVQVDAADFASGITVQAAGQQNFVLPLINSDIYITCTYEEGSKRWNVSYLASTKTAAAIASPTGGTTIDTQSRAAIDEIRVALKQNGITL